MEENQEQQVWSRVLAQPPLRVDVQGLSREAGELAAIYRRLAGSLTGRGRELAWALMEEEQANAACLRGIGVLCGSGPEVVKIWEPGTENGRRLLEKCFHRARRCQGEYMARSVDAEFGEIFRHLADREGAQCVRIAELLGRMK